VWVFKSVKHLPRGKNGSRTPAGKRQLKAMQEDEKFSGIVLVSSAWKAKRSCKPKE
jgi:hypothetical protein